ncbi:toll/interleukin-1 receptor domain-containing protein [Actinocrispum wychmicini]|uniref:TIR domain-containing protein n=1 Tax=Actinocrispum wychmicini TaxID=1213861 RepID=A0A4R2J4A0_9PSEU|nr:toll/interleukin-1 receptor domain-containing protein [Actinocrispum wychmicini]TCO52944.1 TIR domain-containing protein [Actinocrispum wychmicini]
MDDQTSPMWNVFISHSTNGTDGVARHVLEKLVEVLRPTYGVNADLKSIQPGDDWEGWIRKSLPESHVVIVLLDSRAQASDWVKQEVSWATDPRSTSKVIPVLIDVPKKVIEAMWEFRALLKLQVIEAQKVSGAAAVEAEADRLCDRVLSRLYTFSTALHEEDVVLARRLARGFKLNEAEADDLLARHFGDVCDRNGKYPFFTKELLAKVVLDDHLGERAMAAIRDAAFDSDLARHTRPIVLSSWLTWPEAQPIRVDDSPLPGPRAPVLLTDDPLIAEQYVARAYGCTLSEITVKHLDPEADGEPDTPVRAVDSLFGPSGYLKCGLGPDNTCEQHDRYPKHVLVGVVGSVELSTRVVTEIHRRCPLTVVVLMIPPEEFSRLGKERVKDLVGAAYRPIQEVDATRSERFYSKKDEIGEIVCGRRR